MVSFPPIFAVEVLITGNAVEPCAYEWVLAWFVKIQHMHTLKQVGSTIHIIFKLIHWLIDNDSQAPRYITMHQQRQRNRRLLASKHGYKQYTFNNTDKTISFATVLWRKCILHYLGPPQCPFNIEKNNGRVYWLGKRACNKSVWQCIL